MRETILDRRLRLFPDEREFLRPYVERARALQNDCGCGMGGFFMVCSLAGVTLWGLLGHPSGQLAGDIPVGVALVVAAGILGKVVGVTIARLRLKLLYRRLRNKHFPEGD